VVGLKLPQAPALPQFTVHVTCGLLELSLLTNAVSCSLEFTRTALGGAGLKETVTAPLGPVMVRVAEADLVGSVTEVAVMVTVLPVGTAEGAVYMVALPVEVVVGLKVPQAPALPQLAVQVTCGFDDVSLLTIAVKGWLVLTCSEVGGTPENPTLMGPC
jgi:hypothetical protein